MKDVKGVQPSTISGWTIIASSVMLTIGDKKVGELYSVIMNLSVQELIAVLIVGAVGIYEICRDEYKHMNDTDTAVNKNRRVNKDDIN